MHTPAIWNGACKQQSDEWLAGWAPEEAGASCPFSLPAQQLPSIFFACWPHAHMPHASCARRPQYFIPIQQHQFIQQLNHAIGIVRSLSGTFPEAAIAKFPARVATMPLVKLALMSQLVEGKYITKVRLPAGWGIARAGQRLTRENHLQEAFGRGLVVTLQEGQPFCFELPVRCFSALLAAGVLLSALCPWLSLRAWP